MSRYYLFSWLLVAALFSSCGQRHLAGQAAYQFRSGSGLPDYSDLHYWAAHPGKWDPSDSVPRSLRRHYVKDSSVDVFFLHPTSLTAKTDLRWNADIDDAALNARTDHGSILYQASAFNEKCRVFAPRYRQAHLRVFYIHDRRLADSVLDIAYTDVKAAFLYYLAHENHGRPFIIASHSQGTVHAGRLIRELIEGKPLQQQLVAAYLIGMPVAEHYFTQLPPCHDSASTGCVVSWRTLKRDYLDTLFVAKESFHALVTNPLLWTNDSTYAPARLNKGAVLRRFNKVKPAVVDAQVHGNVLWTRKPRFFGNFLLKQKNYHIADINFFYLNIGENVKARIRNWRRE